MQKTVAVLTVYGAAEMTAKGRKELARWLTRQRHLVLRHPRELAGRYRARYVVTITPPWDIPPGGVDTANLHE